MPQNGPFPRTRCRKTALFAGGDAAKRAFGEGPEPDFGAHGGPSDLRMVRMVPRPWPKAANMPVASRDRSDLRDPYGDTVPWPSPAPPEEPAGPQAS